jgi:DNA adenine methylase
MSLQRAIRPVGYDDGVATPAAAAPFVKWAGGKRQLLPQLRKYLPEAISTQYFEPFVGGGAVFFDLYRRGALRAGATVTLSDANEELMNCYRVVEGDVEALIALLSTYKYNKRFYYSIRRRQHWSSTFHKPSVQVERAARTIYLNRCGFNGLYRVNQSGLFNVPFGRYTNPTICDAEALRRASSALHSSSALALTRLVAHDFASIDSDVLKGAVIYCDPPYWPRSDSARFTAYQAGGFSEDNQARLAEFARRWSERGAHVVLSNADLAPVRKLYAKGFELHRVMAKRAINSKSGKRGPVSELIIVGKGGRG